MAKSLSSVLLAALVTLAAVSTVMAASGLTVGLSDGPGRAAEVAPGEAYVQGIVLAAGTASTDVVVEVLGYRQDVEQGVVPLSPAEDTGTRSARSFISPQTSTTHLDAGESKRIELRVSVPLDVGDGGRYALLRVSTQPQGQGTVGVVSAMVLPFTFTIKGSQLIHSAKIKSLTVPVPENGKPIQALVAYENTGNHHYKVTSRVSVKRSDGVVMGTSSMETTSPIPDSRSQIVVDVLPEAVLAPGDYLAEVILSDEQGTLLDGNTAAFHIPAKYVPPTAAASSAATPTTESIQRQSREVSLPALVGLVAAALVLGSAGTLAATKRRRSR